MQEIKKRRIVIASVLKPVDDTRMFEKIAASLSGEYNVHVIGFESGAGDASKKNQSVRFHSLGRFNRLSMKRLLAPIRTFAAAYKTGPELIIVTTHELLSAALLLKITTGCKIIYDIQENYARNIYYGETVSKFLRLPLAAYVRFKEWLLSIFVTHFFLSERSYANELSFIGKRYSVLQNKLSAVPVLTDRPRLSAKENITLLFSGTLAITTGVFTAIELATQLNRIDKRIRLCIVGYASQESIRKQIIEIIADKPFIEVIGLNQLVTHDQILGKVRDCDLGIIAYPSNPSTATAFPTKLFEYLGHQLPILLADNKTWSDYCRPYDAAIVFDPKAFNSEDLTYRILNKQFYTRIPDDVFWTSEKETLKIVIGKILSREG